MKNPVFLFLLLLASHIAFSQKQGQALIDSLLKELPKAKDDTHKVKLLNELSFACHVINPDEGIKYGKDELNLSEILGWKTGMAMANASIGTNYYAKSNYSIALEHYAKALEINEYLQNKSGMATSLMNIGTVYWRQGKHPDALNNYFNALRIHEKLGNKDYSASISFNIGNIYLEQGEYKDALTYYFQSLRTFETLGDKMSIATVYGNIGNVYYSQQDNNNALEYFSKALPIHKETGSKSGIALMTGNMGSAHVSLRNYSEGLKHLFEALKMHEEIDDKTGMLTNYSGIGETYYLMATDTAEHHAENNLVSAEKSTWLKKANEYLKKAVALSRETGSLNYLQQSLNRLSEAQRLSGDHEDAMKSYKEYITIRDSVFSKENTRKTVQLQAQYDFDKKEASIKARNEKREIIGISAGTAFFTISFLSFLFYRKREADKFNLQLAAVKQEALNAQMSDHFIGNTMDSINHFIRSNNKEKASEYLILFSRLIRKVLENAPERMILLQEDLDILKDYLELEKLRFRDDVFQYEIIVNETIDAGNMLIPPMVFQTLAENAIKHGFKKASGGKLLLNISKEKNTVVCCIEDNGTGRGLDEPGKKERKSMGSDIAEKLVKTVSRYGKETSYKIIDLFDAQKNPAGTLVRFTIPYMPAD